MTSTYAKRLADGRYEYGVVRIEADRRRDRLHAVGVVDDEQQARAAIAALASQNSAA
ncbi:hypothetical protein GOL85_13450 [Sinorhizobium medicae]|nr:hypothetical protein [Sinorhizobium medicae]